MAQTKRVDKVLAMIYSFMVKTLISDATLSFSFVRTNKRSENWLSYAEAKLTFAPLAIHTNIKKQYNRNIKTIQYDHKKVFLNVQTGRIKILVYLDQKQLGTHLKMEVQA